MKVGIVGTGMVGATAAYALVMRGVTPEIVLVDKNEARAQAEADDIFHAVPFAHSVRVSAGSYSDLAGCQVVILSAGVSMRPGEDRIQLLSRNAVIFQQVVPDVLRHAPDVVLVVATNPVDALTHLTARYAAELAAPPNRVLGSGTTLDTARFRVLLAQHLGVDPRHVHAYVVGEHGDSEVLTWSLVTVGGMPVAEFCRLNGIDLGPNVRQKIDERVRRAAYHIIAGKRSTYYGIAAALCHITGAILDDRRSILTVSTPVTEVAGVCDVTISLPHLLGADGVLAGFPLPLDSEEQELLRQSAEVVSQAIQDLDTFMLKEIATDEPISRQDRPMVDSP